MKQENNKTKKTQKVQYADDDNHHDQSNEIGNSGVSIVNEFVQWMELNTDLSTKSIKNYIKIIKITTY